ncbi:putative monocarboxylate permease [Lasiosphaeria miniovina]|uniref:Monocarboxylate permease n=1 Tax=Lasiosphaeria miniovina TaxID=1954250 RepID=A0AA40B592_9PEZI|nr:putative monocarboxylate permease [Lasiosphaeria miniovina]KAK0727802.1 putative monocarboxylate permease [Lasiosphaeria miniovina]
MINTFGIYQAEYSTGILSGSSESDISWIGSLQAFLMLVVCVLCGRLLDAGYFYADITIGVFLAVFGMMTTSLANEYWQVILAQGVVVGIGAGMIFIPSIQIVGTYFSTRRSTAMGLAATGSSIGGIVYPVVLKRLAAELGLPWATRVVGFIMLGTLLISVAVMRPRLPPRKSGLPLVNVAALRDPAFALWLVAVFFTFVGLYVPFFFVEKYALSIGVSSDLAFYLLIIMNAGSVPGRIVPSMIADKVGNMSIMIPAVLFSGVITLAWIGAHTQSGLIAAAFFLGLVSGSIQAVLPANVVFLCPDLSMLGSNLGMTMFTSGFGLLIGSPVAGAIIDRQSSADGVVFWGALTFAGAFIIAGSILLTACRVIKVGFAIVKA